MSLISIKIDERLLKDIDDCVSKKRTNRSALIRAVLEQYVSDSNLVYEKIPKEIIDRLAFLMLIVLHGTSEADWEIVKKEVMELWKITQ